MGWASEVIDSPNGNALLREPRYQNYSTRKKRKVLTNEDISKIQELLLKDVPQKNIAEEFNYSQGTISRLKEKLGFKMKR